MHTEFSEWFRATNLPLQADVLQKRWAGVEAFQATSVDVAFLVELFFGYFEDKDLFLTKFRKPFQEADSSFRMRENNLELSVLAGAKLVAIMEGSNSDLGNFTVMALVACAAQNLRNTPCVAEIPELAAKYLGQRTVNRGRLDAEETAELEGDAIEVKQIRRDLDVFGEESNVLWWVFGETSRDTNKRWSEYTIPQTSLMAGKELADLTRIAPGPAAATAILDRVIKGGKNKTSASVVLKDAIADLTPEWRQKFSKSWHADTLQNLSPVTNAIKLSIDLAEGNAWAQSFANLTKTKQGAKISPSLLAYQIYLECLMTSVWRELK